MTEVGPLLARGRSADIFALGEDRVVRRRRGGPIPEREVVAMTVARRYGYPVPAVYRVDGADMELGRVEGRDLLSGLAERPWRVRHVAHTLADLHLRLREIPVDDVAIPSLGAPEEALVHGDLHPGNVLAAATGPIVIDWEGASVGPYDTDAAIVWLLLTIADVDGVPRPLRPVVPLIRRSLLRSFLARVGRPRAATVDLVCDQRLRDPHLRPHELERIRRFRSQHV